MNDFEMKIDYERLRKKLISKTFNSSFFTQMIDDSVSVYDATPEELLILARKHGINIEAFRID